MRRFDLVENYLMPRKSHDVNRVFVVLTIMLCRYNVLTNQCDWEASVDCSLNSDPRMLNQHVGPTPRPQLTALQQQQRSPFQESNSFQQQNSFGEQLFGQQGFEQQQQFDLQQQQFEFEGQGEVPFSKFFRV